MDIFHGAPSDGSERLPREMKTYEYLQQLGIEFDRVDHPVAPTMEACEAIDAVLGVRICKNLFLCNRQQTNFYLVLMPGEKVFKTKELSRQLGISRLSFADEGHMEEYLGCAPGSVSVMGLMNDHEKRVRLVIDEDLLPEKMFGCHPCVNTSSIRISTEDLLEKFLPSIGVTYDVVHLVGEA